MTKDEFIKNYVNEHGCNCDLDSWEPERNSGHSWVCRVHKAYTDAVRMGVISREKQEGGA